MKKTESFKKRRNLLKLGMLDYEWLFTTKTFPSSVPSLERINIQIF